MAFEGSCHCGRVKFSVNAPLPETAISCNCSHCRRKGFLLAFFEPEVFTVEEGEDSLATYTFNTHAIRHRFCKVCGAAPFAAGTKPDGTEARAVNLRCVPALDLEQLKIHQVDGASR